MKSQLLYETYFEYSGLTNHDITSLLSMLSMNVLALTITVFSFMFAKKTNSIYMKGMRIWGTLLFVISLLTTFVTAYHIIIENNEIAEKYKVSDFNVTSGIVQEVRHSSSISSQEKFRIGEVWFSYDSSSSKSTSKKKNSEDSPVRKGTRVRVFHIDHKLVRLDIAVMQDAIKQKTENRK